MNPLDLRSYAEAAPFDFEAFTSLAEFEQAFPRIGACYRAEQSLVAALPPDDHIELIGHCQVCHEVGHFAADRPAPGEPPNWRETLNCTRCGLTQRARAMIEVYRRFAAPRAWDRLYITEQVTPLYRWLAEHRRRVVGSEFVGRDHASGSKHRQDEHKIRHEDLTALSFRARRFRQIISMDVLEHVPDYMAALRECARVLRPGGTLMLSVPFRIKDQDTLVRVRRTASGELEHLVEPEFHGDTFRDGEGALCWYHFGWDLLDQLREVGFVDPRVVVWWSPAHGCLGVGNSAVVARRG
ncbi:MAG: methyltransferase domain-containing protein [Planctomycetota bacterium]